METKKFLFVSIGALIGDIAWRVLLEGHQVKYFVESESEKSVGDGFVPKIDDWKKEIDWADVIVFDDVMGMGKLADDLRKQGKFVIGGTPYTDQLEDNRTFGQQELKKAGVPIIPQADFTAFEDAMEYVKQNPHRYVIKSNVENQTDKKLLFVGEEEHGLDVIAVLEDYRKAMSKKKIRPFQLQRRIQGVEIAVGAFFNGQKFLEPINVNFEHKRLFPGDIGPQTGEMGTSMFWSKSNRLFHMTLKKMEPMLAHEGYVGYIDINCMVNSKGVYPLEFTVRFGYPTMFIQQEGMLDPIGEFFYRLAHKEDFTIRVKSGFQVGVRIAAPPYPFDDPDTFNNYTKDTVIIFKHGKEGVHFEDVSLVNDEWVITGSSGVILTVVGTGSTMKEAQHQAYKRVSNIIIPDMYYRKDIGNRWFDESDKLHNWGYLREI